MAEHLKSLNVQKYRPAVYPDTAGELMVSDGIIEATVGATEVDSTIGLCVLPARCVPIDFTLIVDQLDTDGDTPALTITAGVIEDDDLVTSTDLVTDSTIGQTGGSVRASAFPAALITPSDTERIIGVKASAGASTGAAGTVRGILTYRSEEYGA